MSANEPYSLFSPCISTMCNREVIGIITGIDKPDANIERTTNWMKQTGVKKIFYVSSITGEGIEDLRAYLRDFDAKAAKSEQKNLIRSKKYRNSI